MFINSSHLYKLIFELNKSSKHTISFQAISSQLYLSEASANRFRAGYLSSRNKRAWWPNQTSWFCYAMEYSSPKMLLNQVNQMFPQDLHFQMVSWDGVLKYLNKKSTDNQFLDSNWYQQEIINKYPISKCKNLLTFESHVYNVLIDNYLKTSSNLNLLNSILKKILKECQERETVLAFPTAEEKFKFLIDQCRRNRWKDFDREASKELLSHLSDPDMLCDLIDSFITQLSPQILEHPRSKYPKLELDDILTFMQSPTFNLKIPKTRITNIVVACLSDDKFQEYAMDFCDIALSFYPGDEKLLGCGIYACLLYEDFYTAAKYVAVANTLPEIQDFLLLKNLINYYVQVLYINPKNKHGSSQTHLLKYTNMYIKLNPTNETPLYNNVKLLLDQNKKQEAIKFLDYITKQNHQCPACRCMLIQQILLSQHTMNSRLAKNIIDIAQVVLTLPTYTAFINLAYLYCKSAEMKQYLYLNNQIPPNYSITPLDIYDEYKKSYSYYSFIYSNPTDVNRKNYLNSMEYIKRQCSMLKIERKEFSFIDLNDFDSIF